MTVQSTHLLPHMTVLVIDNERSIARIVQRVLGRQHTVQACESGEEAAALILGGQRFDVILCDMLMPEMSGAGFYERLAQIAPDLVSRLIFITGAVELSQHRSFLATVPNASLEKPFTMAALREAVLSAATATERTA